MESKRLCGLAWVVILAMLAAPALADDADTRAELGRILAQAEQDPGALRLGDSAAARRFYTARGGGPAWREGESWSPQATAAVAVLQAAGREGLNPRDYVAPEVPALPPFPSAAQAARIDFLLSAGLLRYIGDVRAGRVVPSEINPYFAVYPPRPDAAAALTQALGAPDFDAWVGTLPPPDSAYARLRDALAAYREIAAGGPWPELPAGPTLKLGAIGPEIAVLRRQLSLLGDLHQSPTVTENEFDTELDAAARRFQSRNGIASDGAVGAATRAALAVTPQQHAEAIALNLERLRWFARPASGRYAVINTAGFELTAYGDGKIAAKMPVIVGKARMSTPVFPDEITALTFMPTWTVPPSIARKEILPKIRKDPNYLAKENMKVYSGWNDAACEVDPLDVDWKSMRAGALQHRFVQQPGPSNALGRLRFTLHNEFGIFLHDTPAKKLFRTPVRTYSHGCIRVGDAAALAEFVLNGDPDWPPAAIDAAMNGTETKRIDLARPLHIEVVYLTAWVDDDGIVQFRSDTYGRDPPLAIALGLAQMP